MRVRLRDLPPDAAFRLTQIVRARGQGAEVFYHPVRRLWLAVLGLASSGLGALSLWALSHDPPPARLLEAVLPWLGLIGLVYGPVALAEYLRLQTAELPSFVLLTPLNLLRCHGSHRPLEVYRLSEARQFQRVEEYDGAKWKGQAFAFEFDGGHKVNFSLGQRQQVEAANRILDLARALARGDPSPQGAPAQLGDLRPAHLPDLPRDGSARQLLDPASELWLLVLGFLSIGLVLWAVLRTIFR